MAQFARPAADLLVDAGWSAAPHWSSLDEGAPGGDDYVTTDDSANPAHINVSDLSTVTDPASSAGHVIRVRHGKSTSAGGTNRITVELRQGYTNESSQGTLIATLTHDVTMTDLSLETATLTLSGTEADSITDYSDLQLRWFAARDTGSQGRPHRVDFLELEVPDASGGGPTYDETGKTFTITSTISATDRQGYVESLNFTATATVSATDLQSYVESLQVSGAITVSASDLQSYIDSLSFIIDAIISASDNQAGDPTSAVKRLPLAWPGKILRP